MVRGIVDYNYLVFGVVLGYVKIAFQSTYDLASLRAESALNFSVV